MPRNPSRRSIAAVLWDRPYLRWDLVPLAAWLHSRGYFASRRNPIIDSVADGVPLDRLVTLGWLDPIDVAGLLRRLPVTR